MKALSNYTILALFVVFIVSQFVQYSLLTGVYAGLTAVIILISLFYGRGIQQKFGVAMTLIGVTVFIVQQSSFDLWVQGITKNFPLVFLIVIVPLLGIPISLGKYHEHLADLTAKFQKKPHFLYLMVSGMFTLIAPITNMGSIYIVHSMIDRLKLPAGFLGRVYVRGVSSVNTWSPYFASVFLVVYSLNVPVYQYLPYGLLLSFFQVLVAYILFTYVEVKTMTFDLGSSIGERSNRKLLELAAALILITGFIFIFEPLVDLNVSVLISLIVLILSCLWSFYLSEGKAFFKELKEYMGSIFPQKSNEISLLLTAGFFGVVLAETPVASVINVIWGGLASVSVFVLILGTIIIVALLSFVGVHQIVTASTIIATVSYESLGIDVMTMAMTLLSAWGVSVTVSPVTPVIAIVTSIIKENPFKIILRWNLPYAIILAVVHSFVIYAIHLLWLS